MPSLDRAIARTALALLLLPLALLAACGDDDPVAPVATKRSFAFDHIAGLPQDSGYVCPPPADGAVSRIFVGGDGAELFSDGRLWVNVYVATWEKYASTAQNGSTSMYNRVGTWRRDGDLLTLTGFEGTSILGKAQLAGDSLALHVITSCASEIEILDLTLIFKETLP